MWNSAETAAATIVVEAADVVVVEGERVEGSLNFPSATNNNNLGLSLAPPSIVAVVI